METQAQIEQERWKGLMLPLGLRLENLIYPREMTAQDIWDRIKEGEKAKWWLEAMRPLEQLPLFRWQRMRAMELEARRNTQRYQSGNPALKN